MYYGGDEPRVIYINLTDYEIDKECEEVYEAHDRSTKSAKRYMKLTTVPSHCLGKGQKMATFRAQCSELLRLKKV